MGKTQVITNNNDAKTDDVDKLECSYYPLTQTEIAASSVTDTGKYFDKDFQN